MNVVTTRFAVRITSKTEMNQTLYSIQQVYLLKFELSSYRLPLALALPRPLPRPFAAATPLLTKSNEIMHTFFLWFSFRCIIYK